MILKFIDWLNGRSRLTGLLIAAVSWSSLYFLTNHRPTNIFMPVADLGDAFIPFVDWSVIIYLSAFLQVPLGLFWLTPKKHFGAIVLTALVMTLLHALFFWGWPTTLPRLDFQPTGWWVGLYNLMHTVDRPTNCFPSLHVAFAVLSAIAAWHHSARWGKWWTFWALAIAVATLTTKQHYIADVIGGAIIAGICYVFVYQTDY